MSTCDFSKCKGCDNRICQSAIIHMMLEAWCIDAKQAGMSIDQFESMCRTIRECLLSDPPEDVSVLEWLHAHYKILVANTDIPFTPVQKLMSGMAHINSCLVTAGSEGLELHPVHIPSEFIRSLIYREKSLERSKQASRITVN